LPPAGSQEVLVGTSDNFESLLKEHQKVLVDFYAPWCGHCMALKPEYEKAAEMLHQQGLRTKLMMVDATVETKLAKIARVTGYPTLKYFVDGRLDDYTGGRTATTIVQWLQRQEMPAFMLIEESGVEEFLGKAERGAFSVVARVKKGSVRDKAFKAALKAALLADYQASVLHFALVYLPKAADPKKDSSLTMHRPGFESLEEEVDLTMQGGWSEASIGEWILGNTYPLVGLEFKTEKYGPTALEKLGFKGSVVAVIHEIEEDPELSEGAGPDDDDGLLTKVRSLMMSIAPKSPLWKFVAARYSDLDDAAKGLLAVEGDDCITVFYGKKKYRLLNSASNELTDLAKVAGFVEEVASHRAKPYYKSAVPPDNPVGDDNVLTITGNTFDELAFDPKKDVFVKFYAPWCGHCQKLAPVWSKLGQKVKNEGWDAKGVVVAKMDGDANDCIEEMSGYPKLVLFPAVSAKKKAQARLEFSSASRSLDQMFDFLFENAKNLQDVEVKGSRIQDSITKRELQKKRLNHAKASEL